MPGFVYEFDWDPVKAQANLSKHGVSFDRAAEVFRDPFALTIPDDDHSVAEERWITLGKDARDKYVLVVHTYKESARNIAQVRIISARRPTSAEIRNYEEGL